MLGFRPPREGLVVWAEEAVRPPAEPTPTPRLMSSRSSSGFEEYSKACSWLISRRMMRSERLWLKVCMPYFVWPACITP